jgi:hypothetical protein
LTVEIPILEVTNGNPVAAEWLDKWWKYIHAIDDIIDEDRGPESLLEVLASAAELYSHPFWLANWFHLRPLVITITNAYADSVAWEKSPEASERAMADVLRLGGIEMYCIVAGLCGGYGHMRKLSPRIRQHTWAANHDQQGNPC